MATGQKLRGFVGQSMAGRKKSITARTLSYRQGSHTFTASEGGWYRFILWGPGGNTQAEISSGGALAIAERPVGAGQSCTIVVGSADNTTNKTNSSVTFPDGSTITAGAGAKGIAAAGGVASGDLNRGDILVDGGAAATPTPGSGASYGDYQGGAPSTAGYSSGPGCGGFSDEAPGPGLLIIERVRISR